MKDFSTSWEGSAGASPSRRAEYNVTSKPARRLFHQEYTEKKAKLKFRSPKEKESSSWLALYERFFLDG